MSEVSHATPRNAPHFPRRPGPRVSLAGAACVAIAIVITAVIVVSVAGIGDQSASGKSQPYVSAIIGKLCAALTPALPSTMHNPTFSTGYDPKTQNASCTAVDTRSNAVTLYQFVPAGLKANKAAYQANVRKDMGLTKPGYGCSMADQGPLDASPQNTIPGTKSSYGCDIMVGTGNIGTRVDAVTKTGRSVSLSIVCDPTVLRNESAIMVAQSAIGQLAKTA